MNKNKCFECEAEGVAIHQHHVVPRSRGGTKTIPLCEPCHSKAHHRKKNMNTSAMIKEGIKRVRASGREWGRKDLFAVEGKKASAGYKKKRDKHAETILPKIKALKLSGVCSYNQIAKRLNEAELLTTNGRRWYAASVRSICLAYNVDTGDRRFIKRSKPSKQ